MANTNTHTHTLLAHSFYAHTLSIIYSGHWGGAVDDLSKNQLVDAAWDMLESKGVDKRAWIEYQKWRGKAGKAAGKGKWIGQGIA